MMVLAISTPVDVSNDTAIRFSELYTPNDIEVFVNTFTSGVWEFRYSAVLSLSLDARITMHMPRCHTSVAPWYSEIAPHF